MTVPNSDHLTTTEAGIALGGYCTKTVIRLIEQGKLAATRLGPGGQYRIARSDLEACKKRLTTKVTAFKDPPPAPPPPVQARPQRQLLASAAAA